MSNTQNNETRNRRSNRNEDRGWLIFAGIMTAVGVGTGLYCHHQMTHMTRILDQAASTVNDLTVVNVRQDIVDNAVKRAVERDVNAAVSTALRAEAQRAVAKIVKESEDTIRSNVANHIANVMSDVAKDDIYDDIADIITDKLTDKLDDYIEDHFDELIKNRENSLNGMSRFYEIIAKNAAKS